MKLAKNLASSGEKIQEMSGARAGGERGAQLDGNVDAHSCTCSFHFLHDPYTRWDPGGGPSQLVKNN